MDRTTAHITAYTLSTFNYSRARRDAEALRRKEIARLIGAGRSRLQRAGTLLGEIVRGTLERVRGAGTWTFFGAQ